MKRSAGLKNLSFLKLTSNFIIGKLELFFYRWGRFVARRPYLVIVVSLSLALLCCLGFLKFEAEGRAEKLWIPADSPYISNKAWLDNNFQNNRRGHIVLYEAQKGERNVLTPEGIKEMYKLHKEVINTKLESGIGWNDLCYRVQISDAYLTKRRRRRRRRQAFLQEDPTESLTVIDPEQAGDSGAEPAKRNEVIVPVVVGKDPETTRAEYGAEESEANNEYEYDYDYDYDDEHNEYYYTDNAGGERTDEEFIETLPSSVYCDLVETLHSKCLEISLLEMWKFDEKVINSLTQENIIDDVNNFTKSPVYGYERNFTSLLGGVTHDAEGRVIAAQAALHIWTTENDPTKKLGDGGGVGVELDLADEDNLNWETKVIDVMANNDREAYETLGIRVYFNVARSFSDVTSKAVFFDGVKMVAGWCIMFIYTVFMLGRINRLEQRTYLTMAGIFSVGLGLVIAYGLTGAFGLPYTPIHAILPFLALGIGIDDMFVILQCWYNLDHKERNLSGSKKTLNSSSEDGEDSELEERIGQTMQHAGVAITVTSLTDVFAFGIGAVTILPGLQAFCVSCAIGIGSIYLLQSSWFVAWLTLDQRRIEKRRDGLLPCCISLQDWTPSKWSQKELGKNLMARFAKLLQYRVTQIVVLLTTVTLLGFGTWGTLLIRQEFDPVLLLPADSYIRQWVNKNDAHFPSTGWAADIYTGPISESDLEQLDEIWTEFEHMVEKKKYLKSANSWWIKFKGYIADKKNISDWRLAVEEGRFGILMSDFLFSTSGTEFKQNLIFAGELVCNQPVPEIRATQSSITYLKFLGPEEHIPGRRAIESLIKAKKLSHHAFSFSKVYAAWETDEVIGFELWRNLGLAMICVFLITVILLANVKICFLVLLCVVLTLVDMVGFLHFWGITIGTISCINIVLAIGLCVDYSAHIAHAFIVAEGTSLQRASTSLVEMGPAIFNGGFTTFLALVLLGFSQSHAFVVFFKVFLLTVTFGLFHGLVFLPVVLILVGSSSGPSADTASSSGGQSESTGEESVRSSFSGSSSSSGRARRNNNNHGKALPDDEGGLSNVAYVQDEIYTGASPSSDLSNMYPLWRPPPASSSSYTKHTKVASAMPFGGNKVLVVSQDPRPYHHHQHQPRRKPRKVSTAALEAGTEGVYSHYPSGQFRFTPPEGGRAELPPRALRRQQRPPSQSERGPPERAAAEETDEFYHYDRERKRVVRQQQQQQPHQRAHLTASQEVDFAAHPARHFSTIYNGRGPEIYKIQSSSSSSAPDQPHPESINWILLPASSGSHSRSRRVVVEGLMESASSRGRHDASRAAPTRRREEPYSNYQPRAVRRAGDPSVELEPSSEQQQQQAREVDSDSGGYSYYRSYL